MSDFFRFPHTPHLAWLGREAPRDDKVLSSHDALRLLRGEVIVEEKLDGANIGISCYANGELRAQNRGQYLDLPTSGQFSRHDWIYTHTTEIQKVLSRP
jgi:RNA ligase